MPDPLPTHQIRNIGFIAHIDAGKTSVTEQTLFSTGRTYKVGEVDEGTTVMDWMPQERERGITITSAATTTYWKTNQVNIIDTPGHVDFTAEVERSLRVLDGGIVVLDAVAGVQPQSETVWRQADRYNVPRICFVNKMDRVGADFQRTVDSVRHRLKANAVAIQLPIGKESNFVGIMDLLSGEAWEYDEQSGIPVEKPIAKNLEEEFQTYRNAMIERIVETDETLMIRYLEGKEISIDELRTALRTATIKRDIVPVLCGSAKKRSGIHHLLDAVIDYLPSPIDIPPVEGVDPETGDTITRNPDSAAPLTALAIKVTTDPFIGRLIYLRVYSGSAKTGAAVYNSTKSKRERLGRLVRMHANHREEVEEVGAGHIAAVIGLKNTFTGDTICEEDTPIVLEPPHFPSPVISVAIETIGKSDQDKLTDFIRKLETEDPTFKVRFDEETGQTIISGMGELHLEILVDRLKREAGVDTNVGSPKVSYRETITEAAKAQGKFVRQSGGHGQYGDVSLEILPLEQGSGIVINNRLIGGAIPKEFIPSIKEGIVQASENGPTGGYPVVDIEVNLIDGSHHPVDSSGPAFRAAGSIAFRAAVKKANPILLEPMMKMEVIIPGEFLGPVLGDLSGRRAQIKSMEGGDSSQQITALVPLAEIFGYTTTLRSMTQGRSSHSMEFQYYERVPKNLYNGIMVGG